ncbi:MAG: GNAT family N-acetyltransferase [Anaerolineales bacterium]|nr:GNAT family N-acetyltransferase [Anaerolineales bacterium]
MNDQRKLRRILESDRIWCAYALADLDPAYAEHSEWHVAEEALVLLYRGLEPPALFAHGDPDGVAELLGSIPGGRVQFGLMGTHRALLRDRLHPFSEEKMWRMALKQDRFPGGGDDAVRLGAEDQNEIEALFGDHPDRPDAFGPQQLERGVFYGRRLAEDGLIAVAGTHVISETMDVAAVGNVFTHPKHRSRGYGKTVSAAVVQELLDRGFATIVLNVAMSNHPALSVYEALGFYPFCGYYEGVAQLNPPTKDNQTEFNGVSHVERL